MPRHLKVPTLYYYSLQATFDVIVDVRPEPLAGLSKELPLDTFPSHIVTDLMEVAYLRKHEFEERNKKILFTPTARRVIMVWSLEDFEIITARCPNVREIIILMSGDKINVQRNMRLISASPHAKRITVLTDDGMLGYNRYGLEHSALGRLPTVYTCLLRQTQGGFFMNRPLLAVEGIAHTTDFHLQSLRLDVTYIQAILRRCPQVRVLRHPSLVEALYFLHKGEKSKETRYRLKNLDMVVRWPQYWKVPEALKLCVEICPEASVVDFKLGETVVLRALQEYLSSLEKLEVLRLSGLRKSLTTTKALYSIVDKRGSSLRHLQMDIPNDLDVMRILTACPNLQCLQLYDKWSTTYRVPDLSKENFPNLVELSLCCQKRITPSPLSNLLLSKHLSIVRLSNIRVDKNVLDTTMQNGYWPDLIEFHAQNCSHLTYPHVRNLLESNNKLARLNIAQCDGVETFTAAQYIWQMNLNVCLTWNSVLWGYTF